jgi:ribosomal protein S18 acetylase RimI-like enzyme
MPGLSGVTFTAVSKANISSLRSLNTALFPVKYSDKFYSDVLTVWSRCEEQGDENVEGEAAAVSEKVTAPSITSACYNSDLCKFAEHRGKIVGTICCRIEALADASEIPLRSAPPSYAPPSNAKEELTADRCDGSAKRLKLSPDSGAEELLDAKKLQVELPANISSDDKNAVAVSPSKSGTGSRTRLYIMTLGLLPAYRNRAVGSSLLQSVLDVLSVRSCDGTPASRTTSEVYASVEAVYLHVQTSNSDALSFYKKHGFEIKEEIKNYYKHTMPPDCFVLEKSLR